MMINAVTLNARAKEWRDIQKRDLQTPPP